MKRLAGGSTVFVLVISVFALGLTPQRQAAAGQPDFASGVVNVSNTPGFAEGEEFVATSPLNPRDILVGSNQWQPLPGNPGNASAGLNGFTDCSLFDSHDGGKTWRGRRLDNAGLGPMGPSDDLGNLISADQNIVWDRHGNAYYQCINAGVANQRPQVWVYKSTDAGRTWGPKAIAFDEVLDLGQTYPAIPVKSQIQIDRSFLAIDDSGGPRDGTLYMGFETMFYQAYLAQVYVRPSQDGVDWSAPIQRVDADAHEAQWDPRQFPVVGADGALHIVYDASPLTSPCSCDPSVPMLMMATSKDGGQTFTQSVVDAAAHRPNTQDEAYNFFQELIAATAASPTDPNQVAVAWPDSTGPESRIIMRLSNDGGKTWGGRIDISDAPVGHGNQHDHVALTYLPDGRLVIAWRDRRYSDGAFTSPFDVFARAGSQTGTGVQWGPVVRLTEKTQPVTTGHRGNMPSEYLSIQGDATGLHASWDQMLGNYPDDVYRHIPLDRFGVAAASLINDVVPILPNTSR